VPADGYGTAAHPEPLLLQGATAWPRKELERFEVHSIGPRDASATLVSVRV
jgi:hypothetical protein